MLRAHSLPHKRRPEHTRTRTRQWRVSKSHSATSTSRSGTGMSRLSMPASLRESAVGGPYCGARAGRSKSGSACSNRAVRCGTEGREARMTAQSTMNRLDSPRGVASKVGRPASQPFSRIPRAVRCLGNPGASTHNRTAGQQGQTSDLSSRAREMKSTEAQRWQRRWGCGFADLTSRDFACVSERPSPQLCGVPRQTRVSPAVPARETTQRPKTAALL